tara:strand:+ start:205 stop:504 length:300 start_codon:yes stop_codon:yes gene_type:complete
MKPELTSFWNVWTNEIPSMFPKNEVIEMLSARWNITKPNVYARIKKGNLKNFVADISFLYISYAIGFSTDRGYFFDRQKFDLIQKNEEMLNAQLFNLTK